MRALLFVFALVPALLAAQDYRCKDAKGEYWSTTPCPAGESHPEAHAQPPGEAGEPPEFSSRMQSRAMGACDKAVERLAQHDYRWVARGWTGGRYSRVVPASSTVLMLAGDQIELQNGFGNWIRHKYICTYDTESGKADATAEPGRF
jgi:hypothetical protein